MERTGAVLAAAGLSSRMKSFKPMLPFRGTTISRHLITTLRSAGLSPIVVVTGFMAQELEQHLDGYGAEFVRNGQFHETQMFDSIKLGIEALRGRCQRVLIMPMDIPAIRPETFCRVLLSEGDIVRTLYGGEPGHPIMIRRDLAEKMCGYTGSEGLRGAVADSGVPVYNIEVEDQGVCWDVDTREEYDALLRMLLRAR